MGQFAGCIEGMAESCAALDFPVVSGNVSFYNETNGVAIPPTPTIGGVGLIERLDRMASPALRAPGQVLMLIGAFAEGVAGWLGQSLYLREIEGREDGPPPPVDLAAERRAGDFVRRLIVEGHVATCHDVSDGGVFVALAEMAVAGDLGAAINAPPSAGPLHAWLFGEDQGRYVIALEADAVEAVRQEAARAGVPAQVIGITGGDRLTVNGAYAISIGALRESHEAWLPGFMAGPR
jgi:phosphoribosylformylglycinamidine synthase